MPFNPSLFANARLPDPALVHPVVLPDGTTHQGTVFLANVLEQENFSAGAFTYYSDFDPPQDLSAYASRLAPYLFAGTKGALRIGKFCQIAHGTRFLTSGANHAQVGATCYPVPIFSPDLMGRYTPDVRDTVIGHDVWIGMNAMILPGAHVGHGAIVGAGAVVSGLVPDYAIMTGNRATIAGYRFGAAQRDTLLDLAWWDWPLSLIERAIGALQSGDLAALKKIADRG